ncbi:hypothetical protein DM01DRAFT_1408306 [Hesseltinella vesiculosa]|uniref:Ribosome maturation protein SDO1/SBDS N-terminal domain-containing protein n=1 Tax=Hesseltinella vesiculosa TaxID=101127 RepID=A0A1X2GFB7_9FUNG|nr:hypothetical protein DM01DRAFT_1408306 [Hesseltinella vesiculosa]
MGNARRRSDTSDIREHDYTRMVYKGDSGDQFYVVVNESMVPKWRKDRSIPLVEVVQSFDIFSGPADRPSKGQLESTFNTANPDDIVPIILEKGTQKNF